MFVEHFQLSYFLVFSYLFLLNSFSCSVFHFVDNIFDKKNTIREKSNTVSISTKTYVMKFFLSGPKGERRNVSQTGAKLHSTVSKAESR